MSGLSSKSGSGYAFSPSGVAPTVSTPVVVAPNQASPATIAGWAEQNAANRASVTTDANSQLSLTVGGVAGDTFLRYNGVNTAPGFQRSVDPSDDIRWTVRVGMTGDGTGAGGATATTWGFYTSANLGIVNVQVLNTNDVWTIRTIANSTVLTAVGITKAQGNAGVWFRGRIVGKGVYAVDYNVTNSLTLPSSGWVHLGGGPLDVNAGPVGWIESFNVWRITSTVAPVGSFVSAVDIDASAWLP